MNLATEIKNKEDSLAALMGRVLKGPLAPLGDSIYQLNVMFQDANDRLDEIQANVEANALRTEDVEKSLKRAVRSIIEDALPAQESGLQKHFAKLTDGGTKKVLSSIEEQSTQNATQLSVMSYVLTEALAQNVDGQSELARSLSTLIQQASDTTLGEIRTSRDLSQNCSAELAVQSTSSTQALAADLQKAMSLLSNTLAEQLRASKSQQILFEKLDSATNGQADLKHVVTDIGTQQGVSAQVLMRVNEISTDIHIRLQDLQQAEQASISAMEHHQTALMQQLVNQNTALANQISACQVKLQRLGITVGIFFASTLCYVGFDLLSKLN